MIGPNWRRRLNNLRSRTSAPPKRLTHVWRPRLESLEDRVACAVLSNPIHAVTWTGSVARTDPSAADVPEFASTPCDRLDLTVNLPPGVWNQKPGGVEVALRWTGAFGDNLRLYVYKDGALLSKSDGIISTAQSVLLPTAGNGDYTIYLTFDPDSVNNVVNYEAMAEVEYAPNAHPERALLPDLTVRPQRNVTFASPPPIFFDLPPEPGSNVFPSEAAEDGAQHALRFDQVFANQGEGTLELRFALPHDSTSTARDVSQRIYQSGGGYTQRSAGEWEFHPSHGHYHFDSFGLSRLWASNAAGERLGSEPMRPGRKVSFCVADIEIDAWMQKGNGPRTFNAPDCLDPDFSQSDAQNDYLIQGITAGWADVYDWFLPGQYLEVTNLPDGYYLLETIVDPDNAILESDETNNRASVLIRIHAAGTPSQTVEMVEPTPSGPGAGQGPGGGSGGNGGSVRPPSQFGHFAGDFTPNFDVSSVALGGINLGLALGDDIASLPGRADGEGWTVSARRDDRPNHDALLVSRDQLDGGVATAVTVSRRGEEGWRPDFAWEQPDWVFGTVDDTGFAGRERI